MKDEGRGLGKMGDGGGRALGRDEGVQGVGE